MKQVLLVEDDVLIGSVMRTILETMGLDVCAVETTQAGAVAAALRLRPDFMIVDASLGDGSGFAAMAEILRHMICRICS
jgi:DNA-binding response OmpR family regulator